MMKIQGLKIITRYNTNNERSIMSSGAFILNLDQLLFLLGITLTLGYGLSFLLDEYGIPSVVIYLFIGFLFGNLILGPEIIDSEQYNFWFKFIETVALGLIGFKIGIEMEINLLKDHNRLISILVLSEVLGAFILVFSFTLLFTQNLLLSLILAGLDFSNAARTAMLKFSSVSKNLVPSTHSSLRSSA